MPRSMILAAGLLVLSSGVGAQPPAPTSPPPFPAAPVVPPTVSPASTLPTGPGSAPGVVPGLPPLTPGRQDVPPLRVPTPPAPPAEKSIEQMLLELETLQTQKADLLKKEAELKAAMRKKLEELQKRANKLDGGPGAAKAGEPDVVGRVVMTNIPKAQEKAVLDALEKAGVRPGQPLRYPALEGVREQLDRGETAGTVIEVIAVDGEGRYRDIRVHGSTRANAP